MVGSVVMLERLREYSALLVILALALLVLTSLYVMQPTSDRAETRDKGVLVDVLTVSYSERHVPLELEGVAQAADQVVIMAEVSGSVIERPDWLRDGALVPAGETLLVLDEQPYRLALAERRSQVSAAALHLADVQAKASVARRVNGNGGSPYAQLVPHLQEAESRLEAAEASLKRAQMDLQRTRITAPFAGRLKQVNASPGQFIRAGEAIAALYTTGQIEVRLPLRDDWLALLDLPLSGEALLDPVPVTLTGRFAGRDGQWQGHIVRREGGLNRNRMIYLVARINEADQGDVPLEPGVLVSVDVEGRQFEQLARLPRSVLAGDNTVWVVDADNRLRRRTVDVVHESRRYVYVIGGVQEGEQIAVSGALRWLDGALVQPRSVTAAPLAISRRQFP
ncbi:MAG: efflux RND transporter periplasmic adaptor subunit [Gammaproteobacteria bacterium HGW-Gammaproteobacteria-14]|nr:MAG: efflux RND transporter periplasmic adaptor subunit [Gammaproteobacteria bacterium HGW-Gammaproteobacteria-14]